MKCIIPGSFDPVTVGHADIINRAALLFGEVYAVVFDNSDKRYTFTSQKRLEMLRLSCAELPNVTIGLSDGMLVDYMRDHEIKYIVKGVRGMVDFDYELGLANINRSFDREVETILIPSKPEFSHISSTVVRELIKYKKPLHGYIPESVITLLDN